MAYIGYLDFEVKLTAPDEGGLYGVHVVHSPAGECSGKFSLPFSADKVELLTLRLARLRSASRKVDSPEVAAARELGSGLFNALFQEGVRDCLRKSQEIAQTQSQETGLRIKLRLQDVPELADLPWEFLYDAGLRRFLAQSIYTPVVRYIELPEAVKPLPVQPPLRILGMVASPHDYRKLDVAREKELLDQAVAPLVEKGLVQITWLEKATLAALRAGLRGGPYHVFHFIGHGGFDQRSQQGVLVMEDEHGRGVWVDAERLGVLLHDHRSLRLAVLNACEGARNTPADPFAGVATSLALQGIPAVAAMQFAISDEAAVIFASEFYQTLAQGFPVDAAVAEARKAIYAQPNDVEWGVPVLYLRAADGQLFQWAEAASKPPSVSNEQAPARGGDVYNVTISGSSRIAVGPQSQASVTQAAASSSQPAVIGKPSPVSREPSPAASKQPASPPSPVTPSPSEMTITLAPGVEMNFTRVPAGEFLMGSDKEKDTEARDNELPQHRVCLDEYWMAKTPVTVAQFAAFVKFSGYKTLAEREGKGRVFTPSAWDWKQGAYWRKPRGPESDVSQKGEHPVTQVSWDDAVAFCQWASQKTGQKIRLPSEAEWEKAARGSDGRLYPWGNETPSARRANFDRKVGDTTPVGQYSPQGDSPYGCVDMAGNVWEWCADGWDEKAYASRAKGVTRNLTGPPSGVYRCVRGGSWFSEPWGVRTAYRDRLAPSARNVLLGFRLARFP